MTARNYVENVIDKAFHDPVLTAQVSNGFALRGLIPNYFPTDSRLARLCHVLEWVNLDYKPKAPNGGFTTPVDTVRSRWCSIKCEKSAASTNSRSSANTSWTSPPTTSATSSCSRNCSRCSFSAWIESSRPGQAARQLAEFTPQYLDLFADMAVKYDLNVVGGSHFVVENEDLYNTAYLFGRNGSIGKQYKIHITPSERKWWGVTPGDKVEVFETDCGRWRFRFATTSNSPN
jgi:hypothetical protein